ncbi:hypothetical protein [Thermoanaerobacterium thermosaccharolyticum]|uniref:hypothetical protein n=1 Tax=Thermoanaerobacterium thermosaccharolyticum TaxID=1517 RepID=UPI002FDAF025
MAALAIVSLVMLFVLLIIFLCVKENIILDFALIIASSLSIVLTVAYFALK